MFWCILTGSITQWDHLTLNQKSVIKNITSSHISCDRFCGRGRLVWLFLLYYYRPNTYLSEKGAITNLSAILAPLIGSQDLPVSLCAVLTVSNTSCYVNKQPTPTSSPTSRVKACIALLQTMWNLLWHHDFSWLMLANISLLLKTTISLLMLMNIDKLLVKRSAGRCCLSTPTPFSRQTVNSQTVSSARHAEK